MIDWQYFDQFEQFGPVSIQPYARNTLVMVVYLQPWLKANDDTPLTTDAEIRRAVYDLAEAAIKLVCDKYELVRGPNITVRGDSGQIDASLELVLRIG